MMLKRWPTPTSAAANQPQQQQQQQQQHQQPCLDSAVSFFHMAMSSPAGLLGQPPATNVLEELGCDPLGQAPEAGVLDFAGACNQCCVLLRSSQSSVPGNGSLHQQLWQQQQQQQQQQQHQQRQPCQEIFNTPMRGVAGHVPKIPLGLSTVARKRDLQNSTKLCRNVRSDQRYIIRKCPAAVPMTCVLVTLCDLSSPLRCPSCMFLCSQILAPGFCSSHCVYLTLNPEVGDHNGQQTTPVLEPSHTNHVCSKNNNWHELPFSHTPTPTLNQT